MMWRSGKPSRIVLVALAVFSILVFILAEWTARPERQRYFDQKLRATNLAQLAQLAIKDYAATIGLKIDPVNDPYQTGLIGQERTPITTDRGIVTSKILSTNPDFAAAFVELLHKAGVKRHGLVAVGMTGSLPGWNIAFLAACKAMDVTPLIITSVGSSDWGANTPSLTWLDMERIFSEKGLWDYKSLAASIGGVSDNGRGLSPGGRELIREAARRNGVALLEGSLKESINRRVQLYGEYAAGRRIDCYVNIGGGVASLGGNQNARLIPFGVSRHLAMKVFPARGVINIMAEKGIPVLHLLQVEKVAERYGLPTQVGETPPELGQGVLFFGDRYSVTTTIVLTAILAVVLFVFLRLDVKHYLFRRAHSPTPPDRQTNGGDNDDLL